jgi:actin-like ATPase involved in cell morphogenesis
MMRRVITAALVLVVATACGGAEKRSANVVLACVNAVQAYEGLPDSTTDLERRAARENLDDREKKAADVAHEWFAVNGGEVNRLMDEQQAAAAVDILSSEAKQALAKAGVLIAKGQRVTEKACA